MQNLFVLIASDKNSVDEGYRLVEVGYKRYVGSLSEAFRSKEEIESLTDNSCQYKIAKLSFLD